MLLYIKGRKEEIFYLTKHSTHFTWCQIYDKEGKEGNALFNDTLNTFYMASVYMIKNSDSETCCRQYKCQ